MKTILLVDGNSLQWRAAYSFGESLVAQGVLKYLFNLINTANPEKVLVFWDISKSRWRTEIYPEYKAKRAEKKQDLKVDEVYNQVKLVKRLINLLGIRQVSVRGIEADDLISWFSEYFYSTFRDSRIVVSTVDKDLWQLINDRILILDFKTNTFVNTSYAQEEFGVSNTLIPDFKALSGDASDNIPGVKGIGEKTALSYIQKYGSLAGMKEDRYFEELIKSKTSAKVLENFSEAEVFYRITKLPNLNDMKFLMNDQEISDLKEAISETVVKDSMGQHLLRDFIEAGVKIPQGNYVISTQELSGLFNFMEKPVEKSVNSLEELDLQIKGCFRCPLREFCKGYGPVLPSGVSGSEVMLIGSSPDLVDLKSGVPFSGESGVLLSRFLETVGLDRSECWVTNVCKCYSGNRTVAQSEIIQCISYLKNEIEILKPKFIIAFGNEAMSAILPYGSGVNKYVGQIFSKGSGLLGEIDAWVTCLPHPIYALRGKKTLVEFEYGVEKVKEFLEGKKA